MCPDASLRIENDLRLMERFSRSYRDQFSVLIAKLNADPTPQTGSQCLRLCVEAVNMMLTMQDQLATAVREIAGREAA